MRGEELQHPEGGAPPSGGRSSTIRGEELHHQREELHHPGEARSRAAAPPHRKESAEVVPLVRMMPPGRRPRVRTRTHWRDYISHQTWERLGIPQEELGRGISGFNC